MLLQQHLPFTVLKLEQARRNYSPTIIWNVATALTVYGIETQHKLLFLLILLNVATALTVYGIETHHHE